MTYKNRTKSELQDLKISPGLINRDLSLISKFRLVPVIISEKIKIDLKQELYTLVQQNLFKICEQEIDVHLKFQNVPFLLQ